MKDVMPCKPVTYVRNEFHWGARRMLIEENHDSDRYCIVGVISTTQQPDRQFVADLAHYKRSLEFPVPLIRQKQMIRMVVK